MAESCMLSIILLPRATLPRSLKRNSRVALRNAAGVDCRRVVRSVLCSLIPWLSSRGLGFQVLVFWLKRTRRDVQRRLIITSLSVQWNVSFFLVVHNRYNTSWYTEKLWVIHSFESLLNCKLHVLTRELIFVLSFNLKCFETVHWYIEMHPRIFRKDCHKGNRCWASFKIRGLKIGKIHAENPEMWVFKNQLLCVSTCFKLMM